MKRLILLSALFTLTPLAFVTSAKAVSKDSPPTQTRIIKVCVLNDTYHPVTTRIMYDTFERAAATFSADVLARTGKLVLLQMAHEPRYLFGHDELLSVDNLGRDDDSEEIRIVFSTQTRVGVVTNKKTHATYKSIFAGECLQDSGLIVLYDAITYNFTKGNAGVSLVLATLIHELGHLFGLDHSQDMLPDFLLHFGFEKFSWMCTPIDSCHGGWLELEMKIIKENFRKTWSLMPKGTPCSNWRILNLESKAQVVRFGFFFLQEDGIMLLNLWIGRSKSLTGNFGSCSLQRLFWVSYLHIGKLQIFTNR